MSGNARQSQTRVSARDRSRIRVTDSSCFHANPNLTHSRVVDLPFHNSKLAGCGDLDCFICVFHLYVPLICIFTLAERQARHCRVDATLSLFLSLSIRECMKRSSQASRHPLRNAPESALGRDLLRQRLSDRERCRRSSFGGQKISSTRLSPLSRFGHLG